MNQATAIFASRHSPTRVPAIPVAAAQHTGIADVRARSDLAVVARIHALFFANHCIDLISRGSRARSCFSSKDLAEG